MELVIMVIVIVAVYRAIVSPAVPMPKYHARKVRRQLYSPREGVPLAWFSEQRAKRLRALKDRVDAERGYVDAVRMYERSRRKRG